MAETIKDGRAQHSSRWYQLHIRSLPFFLFMPLMPMTSLADKCSLVIFMAELGKLRQREQS